MGWISKPEQEEIHQFLLIPKKETCIQRIKKTINLASVCIVLIALGVRQASGYLLCTSL